MEVIDGSLESPLLVAFQRAISNLHLRSPILIAKCANLGFVRNGKKTDLRHSRLDLATSTGARRWPVGKPRARAFQRAIYDLQSRSLSSIAKCAKLVFGFCFLFGLRAQHHWLPIPTEITTSPRYACNPPLTSEKPHPPPRRVCIDPTTPQP